MGRGHAALLRADETPFIVETFAAIHWGGCDQPYLWQEGLGCFVCACDGDERLLDPRDICPEWDERWSIGVAGGLMHHRLELLGDDD